MPARCRCRRPPASPLLASIRTVIREVSETRVAATRISPSTHVPVAQGAGDVRGVPGRVCTFGAHVDGLHRHHGLQGRQPRRIRPQRLGEPGPFGPPGQRRQLRLPGGDAGAQLPDLSRPPLLKQRQRQLAAFGGQRPRRPVRLTKIPPVAWRDLRDHMWSRRLAGGGRLRHGMAMLYQVAPALTVRIRPLRVRSPTSPWMIQPMVGVT
jgi:hypothetical protein